MPNQQKLDVNEWPTPLGSQGGGGMKPSRPGRASTQPEEEEEVGADVAVGLPSWGFVFFLSLDLLSVGSTPALCLASLGTV